MGGDRTLYKIREILLIFDEVQAKKDGKSSFNRHGSFSTFTSRLIPCS